MLISKTYKTFYNNNYMKELENLGMSKAEIRVYLSLLKLGSVQAMSIAKETFLRKSTIYETLRRLEEKGLVSNITKNSTRYYEAVQPERLLDIIKEKKQQIELQEKNLEETINKIKQGLGKPKPQAEAHILIGIEGFKTMRRDVLKNSKGEHLLIGAISRESEVMPAFFKEWNKQRIKNKITIKILHKQSAKEKKMTKDNYMGKYFESKYLSKDIENPAVINIYGDRIVNVLWNDKNPICFMLINKEIAESYRQYFKHLWKKSK